MSFFLCDTRQLPLSDLDNADWFRILAKLWTHLTNNIITATKSERQKYCFRKLRENKHMLSMAIYSISQTSAYIFGCILMLWQQNYAKNNHRHISNIRSTSVGNKLVDHSDAGAAPTTSSFLTKHVASMGWANTTARRDKNHLSFLIGCGLY